MLLRRTLLAAACAAVLAGTGCDSEPACEPGSTEPCPCPGGTDGVRSCGGEGVPGTCECPEVGVDAGFPPSHVRIGAGAGEMGSTRFRTRVRVAAPPAGTTRGSTLESAPSSAVSP